MGDVVCTLASLLVLSTKEHSRMTEATHPRETLMTRKPFPSQVTEARGYAAIGRRQRSSSGNNWSFAPRQHGELKHPGATSWASRCRPWTSHLAFPLFRVLTGTVRMNRKDSEFLPRVQGQMGFNSILFACPTRRGCTVSSGPCR